MAEPQQPRPRTGVTRIGGDEVGQAGHPQDQCRQRSAEQRQPWGTEQHGRVVVEVDHHGLIIDEQQRLGLPVGRCRSAGDRRPGRTGIGGVLALDGVTPR